MSSRSTTTITLLISIILATSAFIAVATAQPITPIKVNAEQVINILKESGETNRRIVSGSSPANIKLEYIALNWANYLKNTDSERHSQIYVSATPVGDVKPYWLLEYETDLAPLPGMYRGSGRYVIDAQTGVTLFIIKDEFVAKVKSAQSLMRYFYPMNYFNILKKALNQ